MDIRITLSAPGGPDALIVAEAPPADPGPGEVRIRQRAVGVNFIDIYHRTGLYPLPQGVPGVEGAGVIDAVGEGVTGLSPGDRVAYAAQPGGYASTRILPAWRAVPVPEGVPDTLAGGAFLRGLTAQMLMERVYPVGPGTVVLILAAAGGLGQVLTGWAKDLGATVIGTAGTAAKAEVARAAGADHVILGREADLSAEVAALTAGRGADFAIDGVGGASLLRTLAATRRFGMVASVGQAAGPIPPLRVEELGPARSLSFARPSVMAHAAEPEVYRAAAERVLTAMARGILPVPSQSLPLREAAEAHRRLESGQGTGSLVLIP